MHSNSHDLVLKVGVVDFGYMPCKHLSSLLSNEEINGRQDVSLDKHGKDFTSANPFTIYLVTMAYWYLTKGFTVSYS